MKKIFLFSALIVALSMGFTSCRKCEVCTKESESEVRVCEGDYSTKTEYGLTLDGYEALGFECR